jgi:DinB family protein
MERDEALVDFERARAEWDEAFARVPDAALGYLKPGDDYALGGLLVHVNWVLAHYARVLHGVIEAGFAEMIAKDPPGAEEQALRQAKQGLSPSERQGELQTMAELHDRFRAAIEGLPAADWSRQCRVVYGAGEEPYPTTPEDILGWLRDHYREHVAQTAELIEDWRAAKGAG